MNQTRLVGSTWLQLLLGLGVAGLIWSVSGQGSLAVVLLIAILYLLVFRYGTLPLARLIARAGYSIRWKFEVAIVVIAVLFLSVGLISFDSMDFMHKELHEIQDIGPDRSFEVLLAVDKLEDTNHGPLFKLVPWLGAMGVLVGAALGAAMAWSVIAPVRRMEDVMRRIGAGDFTQTVEVENRDELGELAVRINQSARDLAKLHEMTHAEMRGAQVIQSTLLPKEVPVIPGWQMAAYYQPARAVGGDFYDFINFPDGRLGLVVGDVADKGVPASLVMATAPSCDRSPSGCLHPARCWRGRTTSCAPTSHPICS